MQISKEQQQALKVLFAFFAFLLFAFVGWIVGFAYFMRSFD